MLARRHTGTTNVPWPVTMRKGRSAALVMRPLTGRAPSGAGTCHPNMGLPPGGLERAAGEGGHLQGAGRDVPDHEDLGVPRQLGVRHGHVDLRSTADVKHDLTGMARTDRVGDPPKFPYDRIVAGGHAATVATIPAVSCRPRRW